MSLSGRIRDLVAGLGHVTTGDAEHDAAIVGMLPREVSDAMGVTSQRERDLVCQMIIQMRIDGLMDRKGSPRKFRYYVLRNPKPNPKCGARYRRTPEQHRAHLERNERYRRRKGVPTREEFNARRRAEGKAIAEQRLEAKRAADRQARLRQRRAAQAAEPSKEAAADRPARPARVAAPRREARADIAPPRPALPDTEEFIRRHANDPLRYERLDIAACRVPLKGNYRRIG